MGNSSSEVKEKPVNNEQQEAELPNKSMAATLPPKFTSKDEFIATWFTWKNEFLAYLRSIDENGEKKQMWSIMLLNRMGPVGQEINRTFSFYDTNSEDIHVLIKKFDIYCVYGDKKRGSENLDEYINDLKIIANNYDNSACGVKEKIIQDISTQRFTGKAALIIKSKGDLRAYLQSLNLDDIILFWKQCDNLMLKETQKIKETPKQNSSYATSAVIECTRCGTEHNRNRCPAWGVQCNKCKQLNHFTNNCKVKYIDDCTKCGTSHIQSRCPAYGELCTKCGKKNHFELKCQIPFVNNCKRCGTNHAVTMCPAQGRTCSHCNKPNHLEEQCVSKFEDDL